MAEILRGAAVAAAISEDIEKKMTNLKDRGIIPTLGILRVGEDPSDISYEKAAMKKADSFGIAIKHFLLPYSADTADVMKAIESINADDSIHGCLMFRPLPGHIDEKSVVEKLDPRKDMDGTTAASAGDLLLNGGISYPPCTAAACLAILKHYNIPLSGKKVVVVGRSKTVGLPAVLLILRENATVSICHSRTVREDLIRLCHDADIIISATGSIGIISKELIREGHVIVDVGVTMGEDGKLHGDVAFDEAEPIAAAITPVPGGVGAVTSTILMSHVVEAAVKEW